MPRHPSVPANQTGWIDLGVVSTGTALFAIVTPEFASELGDEWLSRYTGPDGEDLPLSLEQPEHEMVEFEELQAGPATALLFTTHADGGYLVEGKFGELLPDMPQLIEVRMRMWACLCSCHDAEPDSLCDGDCHDEDPQPVLPAAVSGSDA